jgi:hypothetical protein
MSSIDEYESLKHSGTWMNCLAYIRSLPNPAQIETHLKTSASHDDLRMLVFLSSSMKNQVNLLEIFNADALPIRERIKAGQAWLRLESDEQMVHTFVVNTMKDENMPRR